MSGWAVLALVALIWPPLATLTVWLVSLLLRAPNHIDWTRRH